MERFSEMIYLVEDDTQVRETLTEVLPSMGRKVVSFGSATEFLAYARPAVCCCLILEMNLADADGLELQRHLSVESNLPASDHTSVAITVSAMKAGAVEFLTKPVDIAALVEAVETALAKDRRNRHRQAFRARLQERHRSLTPRQRQVFPLVVGGLLNKQAAAILDISEVTLQIHRSQIMRKMAADSFAELVRMAVTLHIRHWRDVSARQ